MSRSWCLRALVAGLVACVLASGCAAFGTGSAGLTKRCEKTLPNIDLGVAILAGVIAVTAERADDDAPMAQLVGVGVLFAASALVGYSQARQCRARGEQLRAVASARDEFLGAQRWRTTMWVYPKESPLVALERAYQRAAAICEGRGLSAVSSTPLQPRRPRQVALTYRCH